MDIKKQYSWMWDGSQGRYFTVRCSDSEQIIGCDTRAEAQFWAERLNRVVRFLDELQPPPEEKPEVGDTVEIVEGCDKDSFCNGSVGILKEIDESKIPFRVETDHGKFTYWARKVRLIEKAQKPEKKSLRDYLGTVSCSYHCKPQPICKACIERAVKRWLEGMKIRASHPYSIDCQCNYCDDSRTIDRLIQQIEKEEK